MTDRPLSRHWTVQDLDLARLDTARVHDDDALFMLVCSASFIESGSDTYTSNLAEHFAGDAEVRSWLHEHWEPEELRHGRALKAYVQRAWPAFDWDAAYAEFFADYQRLCTMDYLEPTRGQEMAARCIVEMGTTTYYEALHRSTSEPVLRALAWRIRADEVNHYKHFHAFFLKYREREGLGRGQVLAALVRRALELRRDDAAIALRHVAPWHVRARRAEGIALTQHAVATLTRDAYRRVQLHLPMDLAVRMALKPLLLQPRLQRMVARPLAALGRGVILHAA